MYRELARLKKRWGGLSTIRIAQDREMLKLAEKSGCGGLLIGFESVSPTTIKQMRKGFNKPDQYSEAINSSHDHGIAINGCFVFGLDGDDKGIFERTVEFVNKAAIDLPRFSIATPFPGTPLYQQLNAQGRILIRDWTYYGGQNVVFQPQNMTVKELQEGVQWAWRQVYSFPSIVRRVAGSVASRSGLVLKLSLLPNISYTNYAS